MEEKQINEIDGVRELVNNSNNVFSLIEACKEWREVLLKRIGIKLRKYQIPLSDKIIEYTISKGSLGNEIVVLAARQCLDGETLVFDKEGNLYKIKDIGFSTGINKVYRVKSTKGYEVIATEYHRFYTKSGWKKLYEIIEENKYDCDRYKEDYKIRIGSNNLFFPKEEYNISDERIILLAYLLFDGYYKHPIQSMKFTNNNEKYIKEFGDCLFKEFNMKGNLRKKGNGWDLYCTDKKYQIPNRKNGKWNKGDNPFRNWINSLNIILGFPEIIYKFNYRQIGSFLNRVYSSCGYIYTSKVNIEIGIVKDAERIKTLQMLLLKANIRSYIIKEKNEDYLRLRILGKYDVLEFLKLTGLIYGKEEQSWKAIEKANSIEYGAVNSEWQSIKSIEYLGERETYNMHVPITEEYIANGFLVHNSGKTEVVSDTVLILGTFFIIFLNENFSTGLFAPVESMITHVTRNRLRQRYKKIKKWLLNNASIKQTAGEGVTSSLFILENQSTGKEFGARSLSVGEQAAIIGETFELLIIEQSELINAMKLKNDVFPMGATTGGVRVLTGTTSPYFKNEYFKQAIERWSKDDEKNNSTADYLDVVDYKEAIKYSTQYRRYLVKEKKRLGEDSIEFLTQYSLRWVGTALKFIGWEKLVNQEADYTWDKERLRFVGIDVARAGDSTVVTIIEIDGTGIHIIAWLELEGLMFEDQIVNIIKFLYDYRPIRYMLVDVPGMGVAIYDMLKSRVWEEKKEEEMTDEEKREYKRIGKPIMDQWAIVDGYYGSKNENDEMFKATDREFQHDRVFFPKTTRYTREKSRFIDQILDCERKYSGNTLKLQAPNVKGRHDDFVMSLCLAIFALKEKSFSSGIATLNI